MVVFGLRVKRRTERDTFSSTCPGKRVVNRSICQARPFHFPSPQSYFLTLSLPLHSSQVSQTPEQLVPLNKSSRHHPGSGTRNSLEEFQVKGPSH